MVPIFEDNHLLVLNKPAGLLTQPSGTEQDSLEMRAKAWLKARDHKPGNVFLAALHRLDKPVSGIVVFAKTSKALSRLNASLRAKETKKVYWAWVEGELADEHGVLEHRLLHADYHAKVVDEGHPEGKQARLTYRVLKRHKGLTLVEIVLETGRYHQIRLQFSESGHPILGDHKYGGRLPYESGAIALHHRLFEIPHPITHCRMTFEAPLPPAFGGLTTENSENE